MKIPKPMLLTTTGPISLDLTLRSGQVFHWDKQADGCLLYTSDAADE